MNPLRALINLCQLLWAMLCYSVATVLLIALVIITAGIYIGLTE